MVTSTMPHIFKRKKTKQITSSNLKRNKGKRREERKRRWKKLLREVEEEEG